MTRLSRDDIVTGAGRRFATHGYHGTSMRDLGDDLGILGSSIYAHVGGKQELLVAVIERGASQFQESADAATVRDGGPADTLRALITGHIDVVLDHRSEARTYLSETDFLEPEDHARVREMRQDYESVFVDTIARGIEDQEFDPARSAKLSAIYVLSILNTVDRWFSESGELGRNAFAEDVCEFVLHGLVSTTT